MKITSRLVVPPDLAAKARARWQELGGSASAIQPGNDRVQLTFQIGDRDSRDGRFLADLARELGASPDGRVAWTLHAIYDNADINKAELLLLEVGSLYDAVDQKSLTPGGKCPRCGLPRNREPVEGRVRLVGPELDAWDFFSAELLFFVRAPLADELRGFRGVRLTKALSPKEAGTMFWLTGSSSLGYSVDDVQWGPPCPTCGRRKGTSPEQFIMNMESYPRAAWDGSDVVVSALYPNGLFVTQSVWKIVSDKRWRVPEAGVQARPIHLVDSAEPVK